MAAGAESVAAHTFGVAVAAMFLGDELISRGVSIDVERLLRMALIHDWAEARLGDMPRTAAVYFGAAVRRSAERAALDDIVRGHGMPAGGAAAEHAAVPRASELYTGLHEDYEERRSLEARLVKAADVIDLLVQALAFERAGALGLDEFWQGFSQRDFQLEGAPAEVVREMIGELEAERARLHKRDYGSAR